MNEILTFEQWVSEFGSDAEADYAHYYEEYGDAMNCMLSACVACVSGTV